MDPLAQNTDTAYDNSAHFSDIAEWRESWRERSDAFSIPRESQLDLPYGAAPEQRLDIFPSSSPRLSRTVFFLHGGFWQRNSKTTFRFIVPALLESRLNVVMAGFRQAPHVDLATIINDVRSAFRCVAGSLAQWGFASTAMTVIGWSSGAHLATFLMSEPAAGWGIGISGLYDLRPFVGSHIGKALRLTSPQAIDLSPVLNARASRSPFLVAVGARELPAFRAQSTAYAEALRTVAAPCQFMSLAGHHHHSIMDELAKRDGRLLAALGNTEVKPSLKANCRL